MIRKTIQSQLILTVFKIKVKTLMHSKNPYWKVEIIQEKKRVKKKKE